MAYINGSDALYVTFSQATQTQASLWPAQQFWCQPLQDSVALLSVTSLRFGISSLLGQ